jgi:acyl-[acyl-carrier-protein] desaturase
VTGAATIRDQVYRTCVDFHETTEKKRHSSIFNDVPWDALEAAKTTEASAQCIEIFCAEELYVPDYSSKGLELVRSRFGMA